MFTSLFASTADKGPADDFWYKSVGINTIANQRVTDETALSLTAVYSCVKLLAETIGHLPLNVFRRDGDSQFIARDHYLWPILHHRPNRWQTAIEWRMMMQAHYELRGAGRSEILFNQFGEVTELIPLHPDKVQTKIINDGTDWQYIVTDGAGRTRTLSRDQVFEVKGMSWDGINAINPIEAERQAIGYALGAQEYGSTFYANGATPTGWLGLPAGVSMKGENERREFRKSWRESTTSGRRFETPVLEKGMEYHDLGIKHTDMQYLETKKYTAIDIARIFRVPPHKIGEMEQAKFNNVENQNIDFVTDSILPRATIWEQAALALFTPDEQDEYLAEYMIQGLLRGDSNARSDYYDRGVKTGWLTRNEARRFENLNPIPGLDEPLTPMNMAESAGGSNESNRAAMMTEANAERCVMGLCGKVESAAGVEDLGQWSARFFSSHSKWVATVMCIPLEAASNYCIDLEMQLLNTEDITGLVDQWLSTGKQKLLSIVNEADYATKIAA